MVLEATSEDLANILDVQKIAFAAVAERYGVADLPPLGQTLDEIALEFRDSLFLKAVVDDRIVGSVRGVVTETVVEINRLVVMPDYQNRGIGTALMVEIERRMLETAEVGGFELFTGSRDEKNIHLYEKLGYLRSHTEKLNDQITLVYMRKPVE